MRYSGEKRLAALTPAAGARHVGLDPGFVDEHQAARIKSMLMGLPAASEAPPSACPARWQSAFF